MNREKKFCRVCGLRLVRVEWRSGFDEYTGKPQVLSRVECPKEEQHIQDMVNDYPRTRKFSWEE